jgi:oxygen-independent coproporphyrinogen-3 oxidase
MTQALMGQCVAQEFEVKRAELPFEFMLNALRLAGGFDLAMFAERTGMPASAVFAALEQAQTRGLIERDGTHIQPSARGFDFLNDLQSLFLPASSR